MFFTLHEVKVIDKCTMYICSGRPKLVHGQLALCTLLTAISCTATFSPGSVSWILLNVCTETVYSQDVCTQHKRQVAFCSCTKSGPIHVFGRKVLKQSPLVGWLCKLYTYIVYTCTCTHQWMCTLYVHCTSSIHSHRT